MGSFPSVPVFVRDLKKNAHWGNRIGIFLILKGFRYVSRITYHTTDKITNKEVSFNTKENRIRFNTVRCFYLELDLNIAYGS